MKQRQKHQSMLVTSQVKKLGNQGKMGTRKRLTKQAEPTKKESTAQLAQEKDSTPYLDDQIHTEIDLEKYVGILGTSFPQFGYPPMQFSPPSPRSPTSGKKRVSFEDDRSKWEGISKHLLNYFNRKTNPVKEVIQFAQENNRMNKTILDHFCAGKKLLRKSPEKNRDLVGVTNFMERESQMSQEEIKAKQDLTDRIIKRKHNSFMSQRDQWAIRHIFEICGEKIDLDPNNFNTERVQKRDFKYDQTMHDDQDELGDQVKEIDLQKSTLKSGDDDYSISETMNSNADRGSVISKTKRRRQKKMTAAQLKKKQEYEYQIALGKKITEFKKSITKDQVHDLRDRNFVIRDKKGNVKQIQRKKRHTSNEQGLNNSQRDGDSEAKINKYSRYQYRDWRNIKQDFEDSGQTNMLNKAIDIISFLMDNYQSSIEHSSHIFKDQSEEQKREAMQKHLMNEFSTVFREVMSDQPRSLSKKSLELFASIAEHATEIWNSRANSPEQQRVAPLRSNLDIQKVNYLRQSIRASSANAISSSTNKRPQSTQGYSRRSIDKSNRNIPFPLKQGGQMTNTFLTTSSQNNNGTMYQRKLNQFLNQSVDLPDQPNDFHDDIKSNQFSSQSKNMPQLKSNFKLTESQMFSDEKNKDLTLLDYSDMQTQEKKKPMISTHQDSIFETKVSFNDSFGKLNKSYCLDSQTNPVSTKSNPLLEYKKQRSLALQEARNTLFTQFIKGNSSIDQTPTNARAQSSHSQNYSNVKFHQRIMQRGVSNETGLRESATSQSIRSSMTRPASRFSKTKQHRLFY